MRLGVVRIGLFVLGCRPVRTAHRAIERDRESRLLKYFRYPWAVFRDDRVRPPAVRLPDSEGCGRIFLADRIIEFLFACLRQLVDLGLDGLDSPRCRIRSLARRFMHVLVRSPELMVLTESFLQSLASSSLQGLGEPWPKYVV
jgi:hypothetical protein